jgi:UrcA family protein
MIQAIHRAAQPAAKLAELGASARPEMARQVLWKHLIQAVTLAAAVSASVPVLAQDKMSPDVRVEYDDLDLSDPADVRVLDRRLDRAIRASCPSDERAAHNLARQRPVIECRARKRAEIKPQREAALASAARNRNALAVR